MVINIKKIPTRTNGIAKTKYKILNKVNPVLVSFKEIMKNIRKPFQDVVKSKRTRFPIKDLDDVGFKVCI